MKEIRFNQTICRVNQSMYQLNMKKRMRVERSLMTRSVSIFCSVCVSSQINVLLSTRELSWVSNLKDQKVVNKRNIN